MGRVRSKVFEGRKFVVLVCPRISSCRRSCATARRFEKEGYGVLCLNPKYFAEGNEEEALEEMLESVRKRLVTDG